MWDFRENYTKIPIGDTYDVRNNTRLETYINSFPDLKNSPDQLIGMSKIEHSRSQMQ